jgi:hypothetical protein
LKETPGLSCSSSSTVNAGAFLMRSPLTVVMVCPGGFGRAPGPPSDAAAAWGAAAPCDGGAGTAGGGDGAGRDAAAITRRGVVLSRGAALVGTGFGRGADTTTSGTCTARAAGVVGAARAAGGLGSAGGASAGAGVDWPLSGLGASVDSVGGAADSCVCPGAGTSAAQIRTAAKGNIGGWARDRIDMARSEPTAMAARAGETEM